MYCRARLFALLVCLSVLVGCGSGGKGNNRTTPVKLSIAWGARTRAVNAPSSALSAVVVLANANPAGGDFTYRINRDAAPASYTAGYTSPNNAKIGAVSFTLRFYAQANAAGAVVGIAQALVRIQADGTGIGNIATTNTITAVSVPAGQKVRVGQTGDLAFTAQDAQGNLVAVTPGSALFTVVEGSDKLQILNGQAKALATGTATVNVVLDGKTSAPTPVTVNPLTPLVYAITDLGTLPGHSESKAISINAQGTIVGLSSDSFGYHPRAVLWKNGAISDMAIPYMGDNLYPYQINNAEQVVGRIDTHSFFWQNGATIDLGTLGAGDFLAASSINNNGVVTGIGNIATDLQNNNKLHGFVWQKGTFTDLGGDFFPDTINDSGTLAGHTQDANLDTFRATLWQNGTITDIGYLPNDDTSAPAAINAAGHIVGSSGFPNSRGFLWKDGMLIDLEAGSSRITYFSYHHTFPNAINDLDQIVGGQSAGIPIQMTYNAFLYSEGRFINLQTLLPANSGWQLTGANGINNNGLIVGQGMHNNAPHAFLMTPQ